MQICYIGFAASTQNMTTPFFNGAIWFITLALETMFEKSPIGSVVALHASVINLTYTTKGKTEIL